MMKYARLWIAASIFIGVLAISLLLGKTLPSFAESPDDGKGLLSKNDDTQTLTLITGDELTISEAEDGRMSVEMDSGNDKDFEKVEIDDDVYIIPNNMKEYIPEKVDRELFNITSLMEQGYDDAHSDSIPLIITFNEQKSLNKSAANLSKSVLNSNQFSSIDAMAAEVDKNNVNNFTDALFTTKKNSLQGTTMFENNIDQILLDQKVEVNLEDSVPQIGAPEVWETGYDGDDVNVAVLDSGIDKEHPDLKGNVKKEKNFSPDDSPTDLHGHGTHVASTIAGSGAASDGLRQGVAPGASLINAKVMGEDGKGKQSGIIEGMEWAAEQDADIINMSFGSSPTDGTDPISEALNELTEEKDVLFVVSAGNDGPEDETISAPGTADSALTVGNVNVSNELADTSSRGPRTDDYAITLDLTAPGTDITAARAEGTSMGTPLNDDYTETSGTSMASPHVAGAAALLIDKWNDEGEEKTTEELKSQLVSTSTPNDENTIYEQGGGMVDVEQAVEQDILTDVASIDMGYFEYPHDDRDPVTETLAYSNISNENITLKLSVDVKDPEGEIGPDDMVMTSEKEITIAAGETEEVDINLDTSHGNNKLYGGYVKAEFEGAGEAIRTPVGFYKEAEVHTLTIKGLTRNGEPVRSPESAVQVIDVEDTSNFKKEVSSWDENGEATVRLKPGTYSVMGGLQDTEGELTMVGDPEVKVEEDTTVVLDGQEANEVNVHLEDDVEAKIPEISYYREGEMDGSYSETFSLVDGGDRLFAAPTEPVEIGSFEFFTDWELVSPDDVVGDPYYYRLVYPESDAIPTDLNYDVNKDELVQNETSYYAHKEGEQYEYTQSKWRPYETVSYNKRHNLDAGEVRTEYFIPGKTTKYSKNIYIKDESGDSIRFNEPDLYYEEKGRYEDSWLKQPIHPGIKVGNPPLSQHNAVSRDGYKLTVLLSEYMDGENHYANLLSGDVELRLFEDDELLGESDKAIGNFNLSADEADYRLGLTAYMDEEISPFSSKTETNWTFHSEKPDDGEEYAVPMLTVDYDLNLDLTNKAAVLPDGSIPLSFTVQQQPEADDIPIDDAKLWLSYNDGEDWKEVEDLQSDGDGEFTADIDDLKDNRDGSGYVALKVEGEDDDGNSVEQEITRAYEWNFEGDINGDDMIDIHDVMRAVAFFGTGNEQADINGDGIVDEKDMRILEKNFLKVGPDADENAEPVEKLGSKGIDDLLRSVGMEPEE